jgi:glycosyltransferase involved in cell wall biosynthesis
VTIRVLLVCQPIDGGVAHHVDTLARYLPDHGVAATVACPPSTWADELVRAGIDVVEVPMVRQVAPRTDLAALRCLHAATAGASYDVIHTHSAKAGVLGRVTGRSRRVPTVHTPHAWSFLAAGGRGSTRVYSGIERRLARSTAAIICVSSGERQRGLAVADADRLVVVPNGIEAPDLHARHGRRDHVVVGTVARLAPQKGIAYLLEAIAGVRTVRRDVQLRIAGNGPLHDQLQEHARQLDLGEAVTFVGAVPSPWPFLTDLDIFVLPSLWEGLPYALLEAMAVGLPTVATTVDGVAEAIPDRRFGTVVAPADSARLAREILALIDDPHGAAAMGRLARAHVRSTFTVDEMVRGTVEVYRRVLDGRPPQPAEADARRPTLTSAGG